MPSKKVLLERLRYEVEQKGEGDHSCFYSDVQKEQERRIKNGKRKERFIIVTDDPDLCAAFEREKDRIYGKVRNKSVMLSLMLRAWEEGLADPELDRLMAAEEMHGTHH